MGLNDQAWERLFEKYRILEEVDRSGRFMISASQIKEFREPRLMTKFDHKVNLPDLFRDNRLSILPVTRGDYLISSFSAYQDFEEHAAAPVKISIPPHLQSLLPEFLVSEAIALNCALACGVLGDFLEDGDLAPTVSGQMGSGEFAFDINTAAGTQRVAVSSSQIEIDGAYEGSRYLSLFEAKRDLSDDFLIRQLYYPFRLWSQRMAKPVKSVFLVFSDGTFHLYQYSFENPRNYNSLRLVKQKNYVISTKLSLGDVESLLRTVPPEPEPELSFPQADRMSRIVNLMELLSGRPMTRQEITSRYAFDERQTNYYTDAGRYLGCVEKRTGGGVVFFQLSPRGRRIMALEYRERHLAIITQILKHGIFQEVLRLRLQSGEMPGKGTVVRMMRGAGLRRVEADSTYLRRSSTVIGWVNWILGCVQEP